jgi:hypothetical protein
MKLQEATGLVALHERGLVRPLVKDSRTAIELARDLFAEAKQRGEPFEHHTPESWTRKWLPSKEFRLMMLPLNAAALPCSPKGDNLVLKKIHAREEKPIIVEYNKNQVGSTLNGFTPQVIVIDGKHRFKAATLRGETHILAWVGQEASDVMHASARTAYITAGRGCSCGCNGNCKKAKLAAGAGGGGPDPASTTPASGASLVARKLKKKLKKRIASRASSGDAFTSEEETGLSSRRSVGRRSQ